MSNKVALVDCLQCECIFETSSLKVAGDRFSCSHCRHVMVADIDWGEDGEVVWFAANERNAASKAVGGDNSAPVH